MNKYYLDFLKRLNIEPLEITTNDNSTTKYDKHLFQEKIVRKYTKSLENFRFNLITYKQLYPKKNCLIVTDDFKINTDIFEMRFDTTLLIDCYDVEKKISYNLSDLFYSSEEAEEKANEEYNKIYKILEESNTIDTVFVQLSKLLII